MKKTFKVVLSSIPIAVLALFFQNCAQEESPAGSSVPTDQSSIAVDDISVISKPADTTFYLTTKSHIVAVARSERGLDLNYEWSKDGVKIAGQTSNTLELSNVALTDAGEYTLKIWNNLDSAEMKVLVSVSNSPVPIIRTQPNPLTILNGQTGVVEVMAESSDPAVPVKYQWFRNGAAIPGEISSRLSRASWAINDSGLYSVQVVNSRGVETIVRSNEVGVSVGFATAVVGCANFNVPPGISRLRVTAIGGGGGGGRSYSYLAYNLLSGGGGAAIEATATLPANTTAAAYCVGAGGTPDAVGAASTFMNLITAGGGAQGNGWHYRGEDGRGTPPSLGGTFAVNAASVQIIRASNGQNVTAFGACGGNAGFAIDNLNMGLGACSAAENGRNYGGGGWGNGSYYSNGSPTSGAGGYIRIQPAF